MKRITTSILTLLALCTHVMAQYQAPLTPTIVQDGSIVTVQAEVIMFDPEPKSQSGGTTILSPDSVIVGFSSPVMLVLEPGDYTYTLHGGAEDPANPNRQEVIGSLTVTTDNRPDWLRLIRKMAHWQRISESFFRTKPITHADLVEAMNLPEPTE